MKECDCVDMKQILPDCGAKNQCFIPAVTVETTANLAGLFGLVHVAANNTTYYISRDRRILKVWAGPVEVDGYDYTTNPLKLRSQAVYDFENNRIVVYSSTGTYRIINMEEA